MKETIKVEINNCMFCSHSQVVPDTSNDWFNADDEAVLCTKMENTPINGTPVHPANLRFSHRPITVACRPYNKERECDIPEWCPLGEDNE